MARSRLVVAVTGASGAPYALRLLELLEDARCDVSLVVSASAKGIVRDEVKGGVAAMGALASEVLDDGDVSAWPASGSRSFDAMVIIPCSMSTLAKVAHGIADTLTTRAAAVALKEGRRFVVVPRETPLSLPMIRAMETVKLAGGTVLPAMPAFYHRPRKVDDLVLFVAARVATQLGVKVKGAPTWSPTSRR
jgi:4-hydroxy-3-polyprenylbenzoate decarboxylase